MKLLNVLTRAALATPLLVAATIGCAPEEPVDSGLLTGFLTVRWTIDDATDPASCETHGIDSFYLELFDEDGFWIADRTVPCDNFTLGMRLFEGVYYADAHLIDERGLIIASDRADLFVLLPNLEQGLVFNFEPGPISD